MGLSTSTNSPWCLDNDKGGIHPEKCISWSIRGPKSHFFHLFLLDEGEFQESIFYPKSFGTKNECYICQTMMFIRSIDSSWCDDHDRGGIHPEKCIWWSLRGPKSQHFPFIPTRWRRISRVNLWRKIVWNPRTNLIFFPTWCLSRQSTFLEV